MRYLLGGKLGDFIQGLVVCKRVFDLTQDKADIFISNYGDSFRKGLRTAYDDLHPILLKQPWVNTFEIYENQEIDINIALFRRSSLLYQTNWLELYLKTFLPGTEIPTEYSWISVDPIGEYSNSLIVNRSLKSPNMDSNTIKKYQSIMNSYTDKYFICFDIEQYNEFQLKNELPVIHVTTLLDFFRIIRSCKYFLGDLTATSAMATAMNIPRCVELNFGLDSRHYLNDTKYYSNFTYFTS